MNFQNTNKILKVVLTVGDESGIGPEIILKALYSNQIPSNIDFILVGSKQNLQNTYEYLRSLGLENLANPKISRYMISKFLHQIMTLNQVTAIQVSNI